MPDNTRTWTSVHPEGNSPRGNYSPAVRAGDFLFVSGQTPRDADTGEIRGGSVEEQTRYTLEKLAGVLRDAGGSLDDVVSVTAYLQDFGEWAAFNRVYGEVFRAPYPSRTTVGAELGDVLVEISAVAYLRR
jgi:2-iminobutanoate/2-iminopropanoate deaminase